MCTDSMHTVESSFVSLRILDFPDGKESTCNVGDLGSIPGLGRSLGWEGNGYSLQYSCPENSTDRGAWWATVRGVAKSCIGLSDFHDFHFTSFRILVRWRQSLESGNKVIFLFYTLFAILLCLCKKKKREKNLVFNLKDTLEYSYLIRTC